MSYATCSFYDDVRIEITGKKIWIGEYPAEIRVDQLPFQAAQFWIRVKYATEIDKPDFPKSVSIEIPGQEKPIAVDLGERKAPKAKDDPDAQFYVSLIDIPISPLRLTEAGHIKVYVQTESGEEIRAGRLKIIDQSDPEGEENALTIPIHVLGPCLVYFDQLLKEDHEEDAPEFASKLLMLLRETMPQTVADDILTTIQGRISIDPKRAWVLFESPQNVPPDISLQMPDGAPKTSIVNVDRFGFELSFDAPFADLLKIDYTIK